MRMAFAGLLVAAAATAQPAFEVASVRANTSGDRSSFSRTGKNLLVLQNWSLQRIVLKAYDLKGYALAGPDWLASLSFDINAKTEGPVTEAGLRQIVGIGNQELAPDGHGVASYGTSEWMSLS